MRETGYLSAGLPTEIPVVAEVRRLMAAAEPARAVLVGFETGLRDFAAAFDFVPPIHWTYSDIFRLGIRPDMGYVPVLLARLYSVYEPVRYGDRPVTPLDDFIETLGRLYDQPPLEPVKGAEPRLPLGIRSRGIPVQFTPPRANSPRGTA